MGAAAGGLVGVLTKEGVLERDAEVYAEGVRRGGVLVSAKVDDAHRHAAGVILVDVRLRQGGPGTSAKANAAAKPAHTVNDGIARRGANSFTEGQARGHIERAGYADVTDLAKGRDGVWRERATKNGAPVEVGMDYKGNVTEGGPMSAALGRTEGGRASVGPQSSASRASSGGSSAATTTTAAVTTSVKAAHHRRHKRHRAVARCARAAAQGAACSGVDRNCIGVSDKEDCGLRTGVAR